MDDAWQAVAQDLHGGHHVQPEDGQVVEVIPAEGLRSQVGMQAAEALETTCPLANARERRDLQAFGVAHDDRFDRPVAADQDPNLAFEFAGEFGEVPRQLLRDDALGGKATTIEVFQLSDLSWLQSREIAMDTR